MTQQSNLDARPVIALMTDFGIGDGDVGVMKGVIAGITPDAHIIDITHNIGPQNVSSGAWILATSYRYFPKNTVFVCVVDPGRSDADQNLTRPWQRDRNVVAVFQLIESAVSLQKHGLHRSWNRRHWL